MQRKEDASHRDVAIALALPSHSPDQSRKERNK